MCVDKSKAANSTSNERSLESLTQIFGLRIAGETQGRILSMILWMATPILFSSA